MSDRVAYAIIGIVVGIWALQSIVGTFDPTLRPDPLLTGAIAPIVGVVVAALLAARRNGNGLR